MRKEEQNSLRNSVPYGKATNPSMAHPQMPMNQGNMKLGKANSVQMSMQGQYGQYPGQKPQAYGYGANQGYNGGNYQTVGQNRVNPQYAQQKQGVPQQYMNVGQGWKSTELSMPNSNQGGTKAIPTSKKTITQFRKFSTV